MNFGQTSLCEPTFNFFGRMQPVVCGRVSVKCIKDVVFDTQAVPWKWESMLERGHQWTLKSRFGPRYEPAAPRVVRPVRQLVHERYPVCPGDVGVTTRVDPYRDRSA